MDGADVTDRCEQRTGPAHGARQRRGPPGVARGILGGARVARCVVAAHRRVVRASGGAARVARPLVLLERDAPGGDACHDQQRNGERGDATHRVRGMRARAWRPARAHGVRGPRREVDRARRLPHVDHVDATGGVDDQVHGEGVGFGQAVVDCVDDVGGSGERALRSREVQHDLARRRGGDVGDEEPAVRPDRRGGPDERVVRVVVGGRGEGTRDCELRARAGRHVDLGRPRVGRPEVALVVDGGHPAILRRQRRAVADDGAIARVALDCGQAPGRPGQHRELCRRAAGVRRLHVDEDGWALAGLQRERAGARHERADPPTRRWRGARRPPRRRSRCRRTTRLSRGAEADRGQDVGRVELPGRRGSRSRRRCRGRRAGRWSSSRARRGRSRRR